MISNTEVNKLDRNSLKYARAKYKALKLISDDPFSGEWRYLHIVRGGKPAFPVVGKVILLENDHGILSMRDGLPGEFTSESLPNHWLQLYNEEMDRFCEEMDRYWEENGLPRRNACVTPNRQAKNGIGPSPR